MITVTAFSGKTVAVFGLARSGLSAVRALKAGGAEVFAWDDKQALREEAGRAGAKLEKWPEWPWDRLAAVVLSPVPVCRSPIPSRTTWCSAPARPVWK